MTRAMDNAGTEKLRSFLERVERLQSEKRDLSADIKAIMDEAENAGFDKKAMRFILRERAMTDDERDMLLGTVSMYRDRLAGWAGTPLGEAAEGQAPIDLASVRTKRGKSAIAAEVAAAEAAALADGKAAAAKVGSPVKRNRGKKSAEAVTAEADSLADPEADAVPIPAKPPKTRKSRAARPDVH